MAQDIHAIAPTAAIVGFASSWVLRKEEQCRTAGVSELLISPVTLRSFEVCVERAILKARDVTEDNLFAFLPAKAGCGCSTIALNAAGYLAGAGGKDLAGKRVLVVESDLHSGVLSLVLGVEHRYSVLDALEHAGELAPIPRKLVEIRGEVGRRRLSVVEPRARPAEAADVGGLLPPSGFRGAAVR